MGWTAVTFLTKTAKLIALFLTPLICTRLGERAYEGHEPFEIYSETATTEQATAPQPSITKPYWKLYAEAGQEAYRVLRDRGVFIVKCQDEVCSNRQRFTHVEVMKSYESIGFVAEDLFVLMRRNRPGVSRVVKQVHARKNHSYFLVFWKPGEKGGLWTPPV